MISKAKMRQSAFQTLSRISCKRRQKASKDACSHLISHFTHIKKAILSFASKEQEIDLWPLNAFLCKAEKLLLPKVGKQGLEIYKVTSLSHLKTSSFGIKEPDPHLCERVYPERVSIALVPGLSFDRNLHRLGYGLGYFDRLLPLFTPSIPKWGIGFSEQKTDLIPIEPHDVSLDAIFLF
jgi:5-formyltetrahydrofolate cyclo-ligase